MPRVDIYDAMWYGRGFVMGVGIGSLLIVGLAYIAYSVLGGTVGTAVGVGICVLGLLSLLPGMMYKVVHDAVADATSERR